MTTTFQQLDLSEKPDIAPNDLIMARTLAETLHEHYPGHRWALTCDGKTGMITIRDLFLSGQYGYNLKIGNVFSISDLKRRAIQGAGEILERFHMTRGRFNEREYHELKFNFAGRPEFDK